MEVFPSPLLSGYVLAGGASSRMGQDKAFLPYAGQTLLETAVFQMQALCSDVAVLSGPAGIGGRDAALQKVARTVADRLQAADGSRLGPAAGVHAALADARTEWVMILAVDQPFLPAALLREWFAAAKSSDAAISCVDLGGRLQPIPVLMRTTTQSAIEVALLKGERKVSLVLESALEKMGRGAMHRYQIAETPESTAWFRNLNFPADLLPGVIDPMLSNQNAAGASDIP